MYIEYMVLQGVVCVRYDPHESFITCSSEHISALWKDAKRENAELQAENARLSMAIREIAAECENPHNRNEHTLYQMCAFLDQLRDRAQNALKGGE